MRPKFACTARLPRERLQVRATAMAAATKVVELYAVSRMPLLLPVLEVGLGADNWHAPTLFRVLRVWRPAL
jgi:hypothetical protein